MMIDWTTLDGFTEFPYVLTLQQYYTERILAERGESLGSCVEWESKLEELVQDENEVRCVFVKSGGERVEIKASFVIGADGAHRYEFKLELSCLSWPSRI